MSKAAKLALFILFLTLSGVAPTRGQSSSSPYLQITLDKSVYYPGDSGKAMVDVRDTLPYDIYVYNITVSFPWKAYINGHWDGNQTIIVNHSIPSGSWLPTITVSFTVPNDSRYNNYPYFYGPYGGQVTVYSSGVTSGSFNQSFYFPSGVYANYLDYHYIFLVLIVMTVLVGIMTGAVIYYVYTNGRIRRTTGLFRPS